MKLQDNKTGLFRSSLPMEKIGLLVTILLSPFLLYQELIVVDEHLRYWVYFFRLFLCLGAVLGFGVHIFCKKSTYLLWATNAVFFLLYGYLLLFNYLTNLSFHFAFFTIGIILFVFLFQPTRVGVFVWAGIIVLSSVFCELTFYITNGNQASYYIAVASISLYGVISALNRIAFQERFYLTESLYNFFLTNSGDVLSIHDVVKNEIIYVSPGVEKITGKPDFEYIGKDNLYVYHEEDKGWIQEALAPKNFLLKPVIKIQTKAVSADNKITWVEVNNVGYAEKGKVLKVISLTRDITEYKNSEIALKSYAFDLENMNRRLERSNRELELFAHLASHDLKEPLRTIASYVQLIDKKYSSLLPPEAQDYMNFATSGVKRMHSMINDILSYSKVGASRLNLESVNFNDLLEIVLQGIERKIEESSAHIEYTKLPVIKADKNQIGQLFQNLIQNALKYRREEKPIIKVDVKQKNNYWEFSVTDNGAGIAPEYHEKIFNLFNRVKETSANEGSGIGLAICKKVVSNHGGRIWVESEEGKGSVFYFTIAEDVVLE